MIKKIEIEKKYKIQNETKKENIQKLIKKLKLPEETIIINKDIYYDFDDILEAYKITVRKRNNEMYTLKKDISDTKETIKKEIYTFNSLESVIEFIKDNYNLSIEVLEEKIEISTLRKKYIYTYKNANIEILIDKIITPDKKNKTAIESNYVECKYIDGDFNDYLDFNKQLNSYPFLQEIVENKKDLCEEIIPKSIENPFNKPIDKEEYSKKVTTYFNDNLELLERLKKLHEKKENIKRLHELYGPLEKPLVVTISGTPRSGKTTCIDNLFEFFKKADFKTICLEEPAGLVYSTLKSKEEKAKLLENRVQFVERQLEIGEKYINNNLVNNEILLCDRGILDTYIWYDMYYKLGMMDKTSYKAYLEGLKKEINYYNEFFILYASSMVSMHRDYLNSLSIEPRSTMNEENVRKYNSSLIRMVPIFEEYVDSVEFINTSNYEKMDASIMIANALTDKIEGIYRTRSK